MFAKLIIALAVPLLLAGCAHPQVATELAGNRSKPEPQRAKLAELDDEAELAEQQAARDLDALVKGLVVNFDFDRWELSADSRNRLEKLSDAMRRLPRARLRISGHCDERGTEEYNLALGHKRAEMASEYLKKLGVSPRRIDTVSYGDEVPAVQGSTEAAWAANRRDEFARLSN